MMMESVDYSQAKTGSEIARELNISRQAVSQLIKRAISKIYDGLLNEHVCDSPVDAILFMRKWFGINDDEDIQQFYDLFPPRIKEEILNDSRI